MGLARNDSVKEIVKYYGAKLEGRKALICMEYMEGEKKTQVKPSVRVYASAFGFALH